MAVLLIVWTAVLFRDVEVGEDAIRAGDAEGIKSARLLDPSRYWDRVLAVEYLVDRDPRRAAAEAEAIVREEPRNVAAWSVLYSATAQTDPRRAEEAAATIRRLDPLGAERSERR